MCPYECLRFCELSCSTLHVNSPVRGSSAYKEASTYLFFSEANIAELVGNLLFLSITGLISVLHRSATPGQSATSEPARAFGGVIFVLIYSNVGTSVIFGDQSFFRTVGLFESSHEYCKKAISQATDVSHRPHKLEHVAGHPSAICP